VAKLLARNFPENRYLSGEDAGDLLSRLAALGIAGGSVYDALVGATARAHELVLATRDRRAIETYRALHVNVLWVG